MMALTLNILFSVQAAAFMATPLSTQVPRVASKLRTRSAVACMMTDNTNSMPATTPTPSTVRRGSSTSRGEFVSWTAGIGAVVLSGVASFPPERAHALVKGNTPPPGYNKRQGAGGSSSQASPAAPVALDIEGGDTSSFLVTKSGVRYKDLKVGSGPEVKKILGVKPRSVVDMRYRVEKLGKRSYDGISGETQSVFSLGYGEDDDRVGDVLTVPLGMGRLVSAVDEAIVGMREGGIRRVAVRPDRGWKKSDPKCATEIDMGVMSGVPGAALAKVEDCIDLNLEPKPIGFGASRRMARRFDETLIVEVEMVSTRDAAKGGIF